MARSKAFTLIELLVVVAIIALLVTILMPSLETAREMTKTMLCQTNLRTLGIALELYAENWGYYIPDHGGPSPPWQEKLSEGGYARMPPPKVWIDPDDKDLLCPVARADGSQWRTRYLLNAHLREWMGWGKGWEPKTAETFRNEVAPAQHVVAHDGRATWGYDQPDGDNTLVDACRHWYVHAENFYNADPAVRKALSRLHRRLDEYGSPILFNDGHVDYIEDLKSRQAYLYDSRLDWWPGG